MTNKLRKDRILHLRLPADFLEALETWCAETGEARSQVVRDALAAKIGYKTRARWAPNPQRTGRPLDSLAPNDDLKVGDRVKTGIGEFTLLKVGPRKVAFEAYGKPYKVDRTSVRRV